jgi:predicted dehydrogenase
VLELYSGRRDGIEGTWDYSGTSWDEQRPAVFASLFKEFLKVIRSRSGLTTQAQDNLETLRMTLAAYESAAAGAEVKL